MRRVLAAISVLFPALLTATSAGAQPAWIRVEAPAAEPVLRLDERGSALEARGDRLVRIHASHETVLRELPGRPTGEIRTLVDDPWGGAFVAAEHGIFLVHPAVATIDRCDLGDGAPTGEPVGLALDRSRRLWIATTTSFGVVDTVSFWGRTHDTDDGLPPGPYTGLTRHPEGGLVLHTAAGAWRYRPETGPAPEVTALDLDGETRAVDGEPWSGAPLSRVWPVSTRLTASGRGAGGATLRWVEGRGHNWLPLPDAGVEVTDLNPGRRSVSVVAVDRDLRRSAVATVPIDVAYPVWLRPGWLATAVVLLSLSIFAGVLMAARRAGGGRARYTRAAISGGLLVWGALQLVAGLFPHARGWPFCGFSMYTATSRENQIRGTLHLVRLAGDGRGLHTDFRRFGLPVNKESQVIGPFLAGDEAYRRGILKRYEATRGRRDTAALVVVQRRERMTRVGKVPVAPLVMGVVEARPRGRSAGSRGSG